MSAGGISDSAKERYHNTLVERAAKITTVRNDVYTLKLWQLTLNTALGAGALALLMVSMLNSALPVRLPCLITGLALVIWLFAVYFVTKARAPMSFLQYTAITKEGRFCFQVVNKGRSLFSDGQRVIDCGKLEFIEAESLLFPECRFDFFADMDVEKRIGKADREVFIGTLPFGDGALRCKIVFKDGLPYTANVGGRRIKYFDVNNPREKFVVPLELKEAAKTAGISWPKAPGLYVRDLRRPDDFKIG